MFGSRLFVRRFDFFVALAFVFGRAFGEHVFGYEDAIGSDFAFEYDIGFFSEGVGYDAGVSDGAFVGRWGFVDEVSDFKFDGAVAVALDDGAGDDFAGEFEAGVGKFGFARFQFGDGEVIQRHFFRAVHDHGEQAGDNDGKSSDEFYFFGGHFNLYAFWLPMGVSEN